MHHMLATGLMLLALAGLPVGATAQDAQAPAAQDAQAPAEEGVVAAAPDPDIDPARLELGRQVLEASRSGRAFDSILPNLADDTKMSFIRSNPDMQLGVINVVDQVALNLVKQRAALDSKLAEIWATAFTTEELQTILDFYRTPAGQKLANLHPRILGAQLAMAQQWSQAISEEMMRQTTRELQRLVDAETQQLEGAAPEGEGAAPEGGDAAGAQ